ncbi:MAG: hypothetical protein IIZ93_03615 [Acidaminococcaceae bacterium]|nr:hypothetical protein [Acidaminococcaceae bacterium]
MKMEELENQRVKISDRSITCKDENGKTKGVVTGAIRFKSLQPNKQMEYFRRISESGLWCSGEMDKVYILNGKIYYLFNLRLTDFYETYLADVPGFEADTEKYIQRKNLAENAAKIGTVIPCYIQN